MQVVFSSGGGGEVMKIMKIVVMVMGKEVMRWS
jgi:hypothetical protein